MPNPSLHFAIVGAGLAGAFLADRLTSMGIKVSVFEKSRGTGGRLSSCRMGDLSADLGAPYLDCTDTAFADWLSIQPAVATWSPVAYDFEANRLDTSPYFIATPRQSQLTRDLLSKAELVTTTRVGYIWPELESGEQQVLLRDEQGKALGTFDGAIVATPARQATPLLEAIPRFSKRAEEIEYSVNWVVIIEVEEGNTSIEAELMIGKHPVLARCVKDTAKPERNSSGSTIWMLEANAEWSNENQTCDDETVADTLISAFYELLPFQPAIKSKRVHRWLYARHNVGEESPPEGYLWDEQTRIGACGDWLMNSDIQGAWLSAQQLFIQLENQLTLSQSA